ncbi:MAG TPA: HD-GYP domain-containing protein [Candidatus Dormibacteraeota bacterium]|nr:HD-GYP domain-containing protein [Candidatus Dormibacteraeota bacterium]
MPRRRSELYRLGVGAAALAVAVATAGRLVAGSVDWWLVASLSAAGILALEFPLHISLNFKVSIAAAVFFAAVLLLPVLQAAVLVGLLQAVDIVVAATRRVRATREKPPMRTIAVNVLFNGAQAYLAALAGGGLLAAADVSARTGLGGPEAALWLIVAAVVMYITNFFLVSLAVALGTSRNPLPLFIHTQRVAYVQFASLYLLGAAAAFASVQFAWLPLLAIVPAALLYQSLRQRIEMRRDAMRAMERMADEVDRRDPYTFNHSQRVAIYTHAIARRLRLSASEIELLELAAKVHDIGKIRIPDSILLKPAALTREERRVMETHPRLGYDILRPFSEYTKVLELVLAHHERYDGRGYPNGIVGKHLRLIEQVIPVADSLDAMTTARAYRGARSWSAALEELRRGAGTQWNPQVVEAAADVLSREEPAAARTAAAMPA